MIYKNKAILHMMQPLECNMFLVIAQQRGWSYHFIVAAKSNEDAIERLKDNARQVIEAVRQDMTDKDFERTPLFEEPSYADTRKVRELEDEITKWETEMINLEEFEDDLANVRRETLQDNINNARNQIKPLRTPKPLKDKSSRFEIIVERMSDILHPLTFLSAKELSGNRCYPVSYFDDHRSVVNHID